MVKGGGGDALGGLWGCLGSTLERIWIVALVSWNVLGTYVFTYWDRAGIPLGNCLALFGLTYSNHPGPFWNHIEHYWSRIGPYWRRSTHVL